MPARVRRSVEERNKLALEYLPLVRFHADRLSRRYPVLADELESHGMIGLLKAADSYDPSRGTKPETWFGMRICHAVIDGLREHDFLSRPQRKKQSVKEVSLNIEHEGEVFSDELAADGFDPTLSAEDDDTFEFLMHGMVPRDRLILWLYLRRGLRFYEIAAHVPPDRRNVGKISHVSPERISQIWAESILPHLRKRAAMLAA